MKRVVLGLALAVAPLACTDPAPAAASATASADAGVSTAPATTTSPSGKKRVPLEAYTAYDATKDGKAQIAEAQAQARAASKRVLVMFGGNWCKWCKALDGTLATEPVKSVLEKSYVLVHVDSDTNAALNDVYGNPFANGFPVLLFLDPDGKKLHVQETGSLEKSDKSVGHDPEKVLVVLKQWAPPGA